MASDASLRGRRIAVLVEDMYEDLELWYPLLRMKEAGAEVVLVGPASDETYRSKHGYEAKSDLSASDSDAKKFDGVIIPGGYAPDRMRRNAAMVKFVRDAHDSGKVVAAICHAGWMLVSAGVLKGHTVTCFKSIKDDVVNAGASYVDREVVRDGNLVTSRLPADLPAFCAEIITVLGEKAKVPQLQARR